MHVLTRRIAVTTLVAGLLCGFAAATPAHARIWVGFGFPLFVGPPAYYPPPVYYPPPAYYPPPGYAAPAYPPQSYPPPGGYPPPANYSQQAPQPSPYAGQSCNAGPYVCPMDRPVSSGSSCYCHDNNGRQVWGHAT